MTSPYPESVTHTQITEAFAVLGIDLTDVLSVSFSDRSIAIYRTYRDADGNIVPRQPQNPRDGGTMEQSFVVRVVDDRPPSVSTFEPDIDLLHRQGREMGVW